MEQRKSNTKVAGVDVGKRWLDAAVCGCEELLRVSNDRTGIGELIAWLKRRHVGRVGMEALRDRPARLLSGGEQQRLALARGWAIRPDILFLDEPTANLDPWAKKEVESLLAGFAAEGMTLVMSTHNLGQAKRLATRVVYMDGGRIDTDLPTAEFFDSGARGRADLFLKGELSWSLDP